MSEERPQDEAPGIEQPPPVDATAERPSGERVTEGGYAYSVVDASGERPARDARVKRPAEPLRIGRAALAAMIIVPALAIGAGIWAAMAFVFDDGSSDSSPQNVASVINAFSQGQGSDVSRRYEGELPPGLPDDIPAYKGARVVSSLVQVSGDNAVFLVVYDTSDSRDAVVNDLNARFDEDPWQIDAGQDGRDGTLRQFSRIDDADTTGIFLVTESKSADVTTIFLSVQVISGAADVDLGEFEPAASKPLPKDHPDQIPAYPDATVLDTAFQRAPEGNTFAVSYITKDSTSDALDFYRRRLEGDGFTVTDAEPQSDLAGASAIAFESEDGKISGNITAGDFADDKNYTRIDVQFRASD